MRLKTVTRRRTASEEHLVPLINIVFLILIFFLVASTIRPFSDRTVKLAESSETAGGGAMQRAIVVRADGTRLVSGDPVEGAAVSAQLVAWAKEPSRTVTLIADGRASATAVAELVTKAAAAGLKDVKLLTRRTR